MASHVANSNVLITSGSHSDGIDAVTVASMQRTGMEYVYSLDDDFDAVPERTRLDVAENPFT